MLFQRGTAQKLGLALLAALLLAPSVAAPSREHDDDERRAPSEVDVAPAWSGSHADADADADLDSDSGAARSVAVREASSVVAADAVGTSAWPESPGAVFDGSAIDELVTRAIRARKTPGAVVVVGRSSGVIFRRAYGRREIAPRRVSMTTDTIFDLASLTKPLVAATLVHRLADRGRLDLDDPVARYLPEFGVRGKSRLTIRQLLLHVSGMPASNPLRNYRKGPKVALERLMRVYPEALPGRKLIYSDLGYIVLGKLVERLEGEPLDVAARRILWGPLQMPDTDYRPPGGDPLDDIRRVAPTEFAGNRKMSPIRGEVQDPRAYRLGGVAGHAGLFSTADDLARFARMILHHGELDGVRVLSPEAVRGLTEPVDLPGGYVRTAGWDVSSSYSRARGKHLSEHAFGHGGYTGTSLWIDPELDLFVIFLSNRNHPFGRGKVLPLQGAIADAVAVEMFGEDGNADGGEADSAQASSGAATPCGGRFCDGREAPRANGPGLL